MLIEKWFLFNINAVGILKQEKSILKIVFELNVDMYAMQI